MWPVNYSNLQWDFLHTYNSSSSPQSSSTNPQKNAEWYVIIVIGFFGFMLFSMMVSNLSHNRRLNQKDFNRRYGLKEAKESSWNLELLRCLWKSLLQAQTRH